MFDFWNNKTKTNTAKVAKNRLLVTLQSDRHSVKEYPFMEEMKAEIMEVIKKHIGVHKVEVRKETENGIDALSIEVQLEK